MRNILCLSTADYYPYPTRKQNVMNRLTDCNIVYVNPAVTYIAKFKDKSVNSKLYKNPPVQAMPHIWVYNQPPVFPFYNKKRAINEINQKRFAKYLAGIINAHGFGTDFWIWCYSPTVCDLIAPLAAEIGIDPASLWKRVIYDCVDRHSAYPGLIDPAVVDEMEEDLVRSAYTVFTTANGLYERLKPFNERTYYIANGCNYELFNKAAMMEKESSKMKFGFVGMLQECIDYACIEAIAKEYPDADIELIGKRLAGVDTSSIEKYDNVKFVGLLPQEQLPERIKEFDVCLNVFADNDLSKDVSPLKFYEYLATGKPIVSTPVPLQVKDYSDCIYIADGAEDFTDKCRLALSEKADDEKRVKRLENAKQCSWEERVKSMRNILKW